MAEDHSAGARALAMLALAYGAGLRRAEVVSVQVEHIDLESGRVAIIGKREKRRVARLAPRWRDLVRDWAESRPAEGPLFDVHAPETVGRALEDLRGRAGIDAFTAHDLRRSFGSHLLAAGRDLVVVRDLMGHDDIRTTAIYDRRDEEVLDKAIEDLEDPD